MFGVIARHRSVLIILILTLACDAMLLRGAPATIGQLAGLLLVFALPGAALLLALPADIRPRDASARIVLAFGFSIILSMLSFWLAAQISGLGIIGRWLIVESSLIIVLAVIGARRIRMSNVQPPTPSVAGPRPAKGGRASLASGVWRTASNIQSLAPLVLVLLIAAVLRFTSLGYGEYYDDELDVVQSARSTLLGQTSVIFEHRKGPTEIWLAAVAAGASTQFDEFTLRLPFALASLGAIAATVLLGAEFFGKWRGLLAGLILSGEGIFLAFSRMVQYQGVVLLMIVLVVWCALRFWRAQTWRAETFYLAAGALCWAFGTFTHWDGAIIGVVLAYVVLQKWFPAILPPLRLRRVDEALSPSGAESQTPPLRSGGGWAGVMRARLILLAIITAVAITIPAVFYLQLFFNPQVANLKRYAGERIGFGIFNGVPAFMLHATFYDASPFIVALLLLLAWQIAQHLSRWRWLTLGLLALPFVQPDFLQLGAWNLSLIIFIAVLIALMRAQTLSLESKVLFAWLFVYFIVYAFVIKLAGLHFYALMPALALLAAMPLTNDAIRKTGLVLRVAFCGVLLLAAYAYDAIAYLREQPEYMLRYPQTALAVFPTLYTDRPRDTLFGFPYRYGWSVIGELYRQGILRGKFESNETYLVTDWYVRDLEVARDDEPRYYLRVDDALRANAVPPDLAEKFHRWGEVRVHGESKIQIYEHNRYAPTALQVFHAEQFPSSDPQLLARSITYRQAKGDDRAFRDLGRFLEKNAGEGDALVLDTPLQDAIVPYYYRGAARIIAARNKETWQLTPSMGKTIYAALWAGGQVERWLATSAFPVESRWFGSVRLATFEPAPRLYDPVMNRADIRLGDGIKLLSYHVAPVFLSDSQILRIILQWQPATPLTTRYKVFVHVLDLQGQLIAQRDAEPMADLAPTPTWKVGEVISDHHGIRLPANLPPQKLRIAVGLYDPDTNERLPVRDASGSLLPDGRFLIDGVSVQ